MTGISPDEQQIVMGALDSLALSLADHDHVWTEGEREIYEQAIAIASVEQEEADRIRSRTQRLLALICWLGGFVAGALVVGFVWYFSHY